MPFSCTISERILWSEHLAPTELRRVYFMMQKQSAKPILDLFLLRLRSSSYMNFKEHVSCLEFWAAPEGNQRANLVSSIYQILDKQMGPYQRADFFTDVLITLWDQLSFSPDILNRWDDWLMDSPLLMEELQRMKTLSKDDARIARIQNTHFPINYIVQITCFPLSEKQMQLFLESLIIRIQRHPRDLLPALRYLSTDEDLSDKEKERLMYGILEQSKPDYRMLTQTILPMFPFLAPKIKNEVFQKAREKKLTYNMLVYLWCPLWDINYVTTAENQNLLMLLQDNAPELTSVLQRMGKKPSLQDKGERTEIDIYELLPPYQKVSFSLPQWIHERIQRSNNPIRAFWAGFFFAPYGNHAQWFSDVVKRKEPFLIHEPFGPNPYAFPKDQEEAFVSYLQKLPPAYFIAHTPWFQQDKRPFCALSEGAKIKLMGRWFECLDIPFRSISTLRNEWYDRMLQIPGSQLWFRKRHWQELAPIMQDIIGHKVNLLPSDIPLKKKNVRDFFTSHELGSVIQSLLRAKMEHPDTPQSEFDRLFSRYFLWDNQWHKKEGIVQRIRLSAPFLHELPFVLGQLTPEQNQRMLEEFLITAPLEDLFHAKLMRQVINFLPFPIPVWKNWINRLPEEPMRIYLLSHMFVSSHNDTLYKFLLEYNDRMHQFIQNAHAIFPQEWMSLWELLVRIVKKHPIPETEKALEEEKDLLKQLYTNKYFMDAEISRISIDKSLDLQDRQDWKNASRRGELPTLPGDMMRESIYRYNCVIGEVLSQPLTYAISDYRAKIYPGEAYKNQNEAMIREKMDWYWLQKKLAPLPFELPVEYAVPYMELEAPINGLCSDVFGYVLSFLDRKTFLILTKTARAQYRLRKAFYHDLNFPSKGVPETEDSPAALNSQDASSTQKPYNLHLVNTFYPICSSVFYFKNTLCPLLQKNVLETLVMDIRFLDDYPHTFWKDLANNQSLRILGFSGYFEYDHEIEEALASVWKHNPHLRTMVWGDNALHRKPFNHRGQLDLYMINSLEFT